MLDLKVSNYPIECALTYTVYRLGMGYMKCVLNGEQAGWATVNTNIIVAFWARRSVMNQRYGSRVRSMPKPPNSSDTTAYFDTIL